MIDFIANVVGVLLGVALFEFGLFWWLGVRREARELDGIRKAYKEGRR